MCQMWKTPSICELRPDDCVSGGLNARLFFFSLFHSQDPRQHWLSFSVLLCLQLPKGRILAPSHVDLAAKWSLVCLVEAVIALALWEASRGDVVNTSTWKRTVQT